MKSLFRSHNITKFHKQLGQLLRREVQKRVTALALEKIQKVFKKAQQIKLRQNHL